MAKVRGQTIAACMTCPLCNKLLKEATTISLCLHTFCRKCIYRKLSDEKWYCCPVCTLDLGCVPVEKLRPDHNLQDIRAKIFPFKTRKIKAPEVLPSISMPVKRKERSLSALAISAPRVSMQNSMMGRGTKAIARKAAAAQRCSFSIEGPFKKEEHSLEDHLVISDSPQTPIRIVQHKGQNYPENEHCNDLMPLKEMDSSAEPCEEKIDLLEPLNVLVEAANRNNSFKVNALVSHPIKSVPQTAPEMEVNVPTTKVDEHGCRSKTQDTCNEIISRLGSTKVKSRRLHTVGHKGAAGNMYASAQVILDAAGPTHIQRKCPIWFSLVASEDQEGSVPLPQISACCLRIKDSSLPVSFIQKYLVKKLDLTSEAEVQIMCQGQALLPTQQLHNLVDLWVSTVPTSKRVQASAGSSAKDFVMVLSYRRRVQAS
ncbi:E3 ubiquitin protein ligase DRIP2-like isoform X2 [Malania oleifera]|uniref:E3 ubiquitin protein ligase DRIP2-like isoform X2 n=1 Tax=Malania oleifera TaxID=397392 RepID=UPI0025ADC716|nr:E3 ubiquitin protein ligase DRIP2-like isoform X2 [Malania oleifera]